MAKEIERKFLVDSQALKPLLRQGITIKQGYIPTSNAVTVRVRIKNEKAFLTIKGKTTGISRSEYEYPIPLDDGEAMLGSLCHQQQIIKTRYEIVHDGTLWEVDVFEGQNQGLVIAEVELKNENQSITLPSWVTREVSAESKYYNVNLMQHPYCQWRAQD